MSKAKSRQERPQEWLPDKLIPHLQYIDDLHPRSGASALIDRLESRGNAPVRERDVKDSLKLLMEYPDTEVQARKLSQRVRKDYFGRQIAKEGIPKKILKGGWNFLTKNRLGLTGLMFTAGALTAPYIPGVASAVGRTIAEGASTVGNALVALPGAAANFVRGVPNEGELTLPLTPRQALFTGGLSAATGVVGLGAGALASGLAVHTVMSNRRGRREEARRERRRRRSVPMAQVVRTVTAAPEDIPEVDVEVVDPQLDRNVQGTYNVADNRSGNRSRRRRRRPDADGGTVPGGRDGPRRPRPSGAEADYRTAP